jgi:exodeoxyribonuclease-5
MDTIPELTEEQNCVIQYIKKNILHKKYITLGGYAGTGKSTCLTYLTKQFSNFPVCAFTGKAANVLRKKGIVANTIHSTIYNVELDHHGNPRFKLKKYHQLGPNVGGFLVDEASMISKELMDDLLSFHLPIVFLGDHGQLEPIGGSHNLMQNPDCKLETIHRNANSIAKFASFLREGNSAINFPTNDRVKLIAKKNIELEKVLYFDQVICAYNKTRLAVNTQIRKLFGYDESPQKNDKIICLKNNRTFGVYNGMMGNIISLNKKNMLHFETDDGMKITIPIDKKQFGKEKILESANENKDLGYFDFGYCITCHKAQGDEWDQVLVIEEKCSMWDHSRWAYTAASRAKELLFWAV